MLYPDPVRAFLAVLVCVAVFLPPLNFAPNRLFPGEDVYWVGVLHGWMYLPIVVALGLLGLSIFIKRMTLPAALLMGLLLFWLVGHAAQLLAASAGTAARASLSSGFWTLLFCIFLLIIDAMRRDRQRRWGSIVLLLIVIFAAGLLYQGQWADISIVKEYHNQP